MEPRHEEIVGFEPALHTESPKARARTAWRCARGYDLAAAAGLRGLRVSHPTRSFRALIFLAILSSLAAAEPEAASSRFTTVDVIVDAGSDSLAAYQVEVVASGDAKIVGAAAVSESVRREDRRGVRLCLAGGCSAERVCHDHRGATDPRYRARAPGSRAPLRRGQAGGPCGDAVDARAVERLCADGSQHRAGQEDRHRHHLLPHAGLQGRRVRAGLSAAGGRTGTPGQARQPSSGGDLALSVDIEAGMPIESVHSLAHAVDIRRPSIRSAHVELAQPAQLPGRDFVLRYRTAGKALKVGWVGHADERGGFFSLTLQPPAKLARDDGRLQSESPALTQVEIDWGSLQVSDVHPATIPDLFSGHPVVLHGRYGGVDSTTITVSGRAGSRRQSYRVTVSTADLAAEQPALASMWARAHIEALERESSAHEPQCITQITDTALEYRLTSAYTTFLVIDANSGTDLPQSRP